MDMHVCTQLMCVSGGGVREVEELGKGSKGEIEQDG